MPSLIALLRHAQVAGQRELQAAADRVTREHREGGVGEGLQRVDRFGERVRHEPLGALLELLLWDLADVIARPRTSRVRR